MNDKINRPPLQCTVLRNGESAPDLKQSHKNLVTGSVSGVTDESISPEIRAHIEKVSKMRIFDGPEREQSDQ